MIIFIENILLANMKHLESQKSYYIAKKMFLVSNLVLKCLFSQFLLIFIEQSLYLCGSVRIISFC